MPGRVAPGPPDPPPPAPSSGGRLEAAPESSVRAIQLGRDSSGTSIAPPKIEHFIGRKALLEALQDAYRGLLEERLVFALVRGAAGAGKSALLHHFTMGLRHAQGAVVLRGRCLEAERSPYNAFASLSDALSRYLRRMPPAEAQRLLPRDIHALARVFPALQRVPAVADAPRMAETPDAQELRRRGFAALRQLLWRIAERRPLVVCVEDLQWSDTDSVALLLELTRPPDAPAMLFIGSYRTEEAASSAPLAALLAQRDAIAPEDQRREIEVGPLAPVEAEELALALLFARDPDSRARADAIARKSGGNPRLVEELVRAHQAAPEGAGGGIDAALGEALRVRLARLPAQAMRLLEVIAVANGPVHPAVAVRAAKLAPDDQAAAINLLRTEDLVLLRRTGGEDTLETAYDALREALVARLDADRLAACHRRLARALQGAGTADAEVLAMHWLGAGIIRKAGRYAALAADQAADALAFERAARLYQLALDLRSVPDPDPPTSHGAADAPEAALSLADRRALAIRCGDALVHAGKSAEAAKVYATAAEGADAWLGLELRRRAAEQHLRSGHIDEGLSLLKAVLRAVGLSFPATPRRSLASLLLHRAEIRVRGIRFRERPERDVRPEELARIDACWSVTVGLSAVDLIRSADFSARALLLALRAGEPYRVARALAFEASSACMVGSDNRARAEELVRTLRALAERLDSPHALGLSMMVSGILEAFAGGRWKDALAWYAKADELFRDRCTGVAWELVTTQLLTSWARWYRGQIQALAQALPGVLRGAEQRGDLYAIAILSVPAAWVSLASDDVAGARRAIGSAMSRWSQSGFHLEHFVALLAETYVDRYAGRAAAGWKRFETQWRALDGSLLLRLQNNRIMAWMERACTALAAAEGAADPEPFVHSALRDAASIAREKMPWSDPFVPMIRAGAAALRNDKAQALALLDEAAAGFEAADMGLYAAAVRRQAGELAGGEKGLQRLLVADAFMARENIKSPARWAAMLAPGFGRR